jgi:putative phosphoribosyl transferase
MLFKNRREAGQKLARRLRGFKNQNCVCLAIPRGGVVVGREIASFLDCPLGAVVTKKIGAPFDPELAIGAVTPDGKVILNRSLAGKVGATPEYLAREIAQKKKEIKRRRELFGPPPPLEKKTVILTDDGLVTGRTLAAILSWVRRQKPQKLVLALPVAAPESLKKLKKLVEKVVCLKTPLSFSALSQFYQDFSQVEDQEVVNLLKLK